MGRGCLPKAFDPFKKQSGRRRRDLLLHLRGGALRQHSIIKHTTDAVVLRDLKELNIAFSARCGHLRTSGCESATRGRVSRRRGFSGDGT
jgi:hypothetical protein